MTVTVQHLPITAANDTARGAKLANTSSGGAHQRPAGRRAGDLANVRLALVSLTPASSAIRLGLSDGSVDVLGKTNSNTRL